MVGINLHFFSPASLSAGSGYRTEQQKSFFVVWLARDVNVVDCMRVGLSSYLFLRRSHVGLVSCGWKWMI